MKIRSFLLRALVPATLACQAPASIIVPEYLPAVSSPDSFDTGTPDKLTDGSGLSAPVTEGTPLVEALAVSHALDGGYAQSWVTNDPLPAGGDYFAEASQAPVLVFDLGEDRELGRLLFWQYQNSGGGGTATRGNNARIIEVRINTEAEGFADFSSPATTMTLASSGDANPAQIFEFIGVGRYLQLTVADNFFGQPGFAGGGDRVGLGEFRAVLKGDPELVVPAAIDVSSANATGARTIDIPVSNDGKTFDLEIPAVRVTGPDAAVFTVVSPTTLAPGEEGVIQLSFDPAGNAGEYDATLEIDSNDTYFATLSIPISGLIRDPWIDTVASITLPRVEDDSPVAFEVTVGNFGESGDLVISGVFLGGADASYFSVVTGFPLTIAPGASEQIVFSYDPEGESRIFQATLEFDSNDAMQPIHIVPVIATGVVPVGLAAIVVPEYLPAASSPDSFDTGTPHKLTDGSGLPALAPLPAGATLVEALGVTHALDGGYAQSWVTNDPLPAGGDYFAEASQAPILVFDLGEDRELGRLLFWQYQNTGGGGTATRGNNARTIDVRINTEAQGFADFSGPVTTMTLASSDSTNPAQAFRYVASGRYLQLTVTDNFFGQPGFTGGGDRVGLGEFRAVLKGDPELVAPDSIDVSSANATGARTIGVPVANIGSTLGLDLVGLRVTGLDAGFFTVVSPVTPSTLAPGAEGVIQISFDPAGYAGEFEATLEIDSNDAHFATVSVPVYGLIRDPWIDTVDSVTLPPMGDDDPAPVAFEVTVGNLGESGDLVIDGAFLGGTDASYFSVVTGFPLTIAPGASAQVVFSFDPGGESRTFQAALEFDSNDIVQPTRIVPVTAIYVAQGFDAWAASHGIPADEQYDGGDHDGIPALLEYALGFDPALAETMPVPQRDEDGIAIVWPKGEMAAADPSLSYEVQVSSNLRDWGSPVAGTLTESDTSLTLRLVDGGSGKIFARLRIVREAP